MAQAITSLQMEIEAQLAALRSVAPPPASNRIVVPQGTKSFRFPDGRTTTDPISAVILDYRYVNSYYTSAFNPSSRTPPVCWAVGQDSRAMTPDEAGGTVQCTDCASCPKNQFGSNGRGKACKNNIRLAVVPPDATLETNPWILTVSPTGIKQFTAYLNNLLTVHGKVPLQIVTKIGFNPKEAFATLVFGLEGINEDLEIALKLKEVAQSALDHGFEF
jgi:hypothetical protein